MYTNTLTLARIITPAKIPERRDNVLVFCILAVSDGTFVVLVEVANSKSNFKA